MAELRRQEEERLREQQRRLEEQRRRARWVGLLCLTVWAIILISDFVTLMDSPGDATTDVIITLVIMLVAIGGGLFGLRALRNRQRQEQQAEVSRRAAIMRPATGEQEMEVVWEAGPTRNPRNRSKGTKMRDTRIVEAEQDLVNENFWKRRVEIANILGDLGDKQTLSFLEEVIEFEADERVRSALWESYQKLENKF